MEPWSHWWYATLSGSGVDTVWVSAGCCEFTESLLTLHCVEASAMSGRPNHLAIVQGRNWTDFFWGHWTAGGSDFAVVEITSALICRTVAKPFDPGMLARRRAGRQVSFCQLKLFLGNCCTCHTIVCEDQGAVIFMLALRHGTLWYSVASPRESKGSSFPNSHSATFSAWL